MQDALKCTDFAFAQNVWRDKRPQYAGNCNWRLETYGTTRALYDSVQTTGEIMKTSMASQDYYPLRPAMYVDLSKVNYLSAGTVSSNNTMFEKNAMVINENETPKPNKPENPVYKVKKIRLSRSFPQDCCREKAHFKSHDFSFQRNQ